MLRSVSIRCSLDAIGRIPVSGIYHKKRILNRFFHPAEIMPDKLKYQDIS
jgi:hypothetical protein